ncbi:MAG: hypothetical protein N2112_00295 [Gemmataceae bacterium]|jgi:hypothetical protein|nr:hypothetical protein [Gemmataceae bacterium]
MQGMVRFYDQKTRRVINIPETELTSESKKVQIEGIEGEVWINPTKELPSFKPNRPIKWSSLEQNLSSHDKIEIVLPKLTIRVTDVCSSRMVNQDHEVHHENFPIPNWRNLLRLVMIFTKLIPKETCPHRQLEIFLCLMTCHISNPDTILQVFKSEILSEEEIKAIAQKYFESHFSDT